ILTVTDDLGCTATSSYEVPNIEGPIIDASSIVITPVSCNDDPGSISGIIIIDNGLTTSYMWNGTISNSPNISDLPAGNYTLTVTDDNGCSTSFGPISIDKLNPPIVDATPAYSEIEEGENVSLSTSLFSDSPITEINWTPPSGLSCSDCPSPIASPNQTTIYVVTVTNEDGCST